ncbi:MAG: hypothetical protein KDB00_21455 [Planctomycetales bacterium]|nr:hypothetical protein [Planctomycetales bacterium]
MSIIAADVACPVGLCIEQAATSVAAGIARVEETSWVAPNGNPIKMGRLANDALPLLIKEIADDKSLTQHAQRLIRMGSIVFNVVGEKLTGLEGPLHGFFAMPEPMGNRQSDPTMLIRNAIRNSEAKLRLDSTNVFSGGRASIFEALLAAQALLQSSPNAIAIVGGIDSYHDPFILSHLGTQHRLLTEGAADGMIPGEGVGMIVCVDPSRMGSMNVSPLAEINAVGVAQEPGHLTSEDPCLGEGSSEAISQALANSQQVNQVFLSFNGEHFWAKEWSIAFLRHSDSFLREHGVHHPAEHFGDTGAASGAIMIALSAFAFSTGKAAGEHLVWCASDGPLRGACTLKNPSQQES